MLKTLADLRLGEKGVIQSFKDEIMSLKFLEMGCLPNMEVELVQIAPLGDPICIRTPDYQILMRREEAATIVILKVSR
jgi:ferrous iron transport protein A